MKESFLEQQSSKSEKYRGLNPELSDERLEYMVMTDDLLELEQDRKLSFIDIVVEEPADEVLARLQQTRIGGELLSGDDSQLAIESDGDYFPALDITKSQSTLIGAGVRVWGWGAEESVHRNLELELFYVQKAEQFTEVVGLSMGASGQALATGSILMPAYAEQGYEGHNFTTMYDVTDEDIAEFNTVVRRAIGSDPESYGMRQGRCLRDAMDQAATTEARDAMQMVLERTWPAQASYILTRKHEGADVSIAEMAADPDRVSEAIDAMAQFLATWNMPPLK